MVLAILQELETPGDSALHEPLGHAIRCRIAVGRNAGRKAFTLQTIPPQEQQSTDNQLAKANSFLLQAGVSARDQHQRKLGRQCRYVAHLASLVTETEGRSKPLPRVVLPLQPLPTTAVIKVAKPRVRFGSRTGHISLPFGRAGR